MQIYLDEPIVIDGIKIGHTHEGLKHLIAHYEHILKTASPKQLAEPDRQHLEFTLLVNLKHHLHLYESKIQITK